MINEELRGVPEFVLREATTKYVDELRQHLKRYILIDKSDNAVQQREAFDMMNGVLDDLEKEAFELLEQKLWLFLRRV